MSSESDLRFDSEPELEPDPEVDWDVELERQGAAAAAAAAAAADADTGERDGKEVGAGQRNLEERLKSALWFHIGKIVDSETISLGVNATPQFIGSLTELVWTQIESTAVDLESFAKHGKRSRIQTEDVLLLARRNEGLESVLRDFVEKKAKQKQKQRRDDKGAEKVRRGGGAGGSGRNAGGSGGGGGGGGGGGVKKGKEKATVSGKGKGKGGRGRPKGSGSG